MCSCGSIAGFRIFARLGCHLDHRIVANVCLGSRSAAGLSFDDERTRAKRRRQGGSTVQRSRIAIGRSDSARPGELPAAHRRAYLNGVRYEGLAEALRLPLGAVKRSCSARQQLRRMLETDLK
jgi:DNA-directed RNA polymerase specialized sigma24 family protein